MGSVQALTEEQEEQGFAAEMRAKAQAKRKAMAQEPAPVGFLSVSSLSVAFAQAKRKTMAPEPAPVGCLSVGSLSVAFLNTQS